MGAAQAVPETLSLEIDTSNVAREVEADVASGGGLKVFAENFEIANQEDANLFGQWRRALADRKQAIIDRLAPAKKKAHDAHKEICKLENDAVKPIDDAIEIADPKITGWLEEQERRAARWDTAAQAEQTRIEDEARLSEALAHEQAGDHEQALAVLEEPAITTLRSSSITKPRVSGVQPRTAWSAQVTDKMKLVKAIACVCGKCECKGNPALLGLVDPNMPGLNAMAKAQKQNLNIPGVKPVSDKQVARGR